MIPTTAPKTHRTGTYFHSQIAKYAEMNVIQLATERADVNKRLSTLKKGDAFHLKAFLDDKALKRLGI